ncbi:MAG: FAD-binding protein [Clostridiales bacterium]|jgi:succinate dehydrogenase/fumarate reductase flavoprotein subunit|nr:FAD-binding protein [Clostridiales bacterium]
MAKRKKTAAGRLFTVILLLLTVITIGRYSLRQEPRVYPEIPQSFDVVVIGNGLAGATAALTAAQNGADVFYLDLSEPGAGEFPAFSPAFWASATLTQSAQNIEYLPEEMAQELFTAGNEEGNFKQILRLSEESAEALSWLEQLTGVMFSRVPDPENSPGLHYPAVGKAETFVALALQKGLADLLAGSSRTLLPQKILVKNGRVMGMIVKDREGREMEVRCRAVILAGGSGAANGLTLALAVGAEAVQGDDSPALPVYLPAGRRAVTEDFPDAVLISANGEVLPTGTTLAETIQTGGGKVYVLAGAEQFSGNENFVAVDDLTSLAAGLGVDEEKLQPLITGIAPPYHVAVLGLRSISTGGLLVDEYYRVLGADGEITGLLAAGDAAAGLHGRGAIFDLVFSEMIISARLSGKEAAEQASR